MSILSEVLLNRDPVQTLQVRKQMKLLSKIDIARETNNLSVNELATKMNIKPRKLKDILSGTCNVDLNTLFLFESVLDINLINLEYE